MALYLSCALPAGAWEVHGAPAESTNLGNNDYRNGKRNGRIINSYLVANDDGNLTRVEYTGEKVVVEEYSADFQFISGFSIDAELPLFGGFYSGETHNFLVFGQENDAEDDNTEVIRVVCYTKDWQRVGSDGLYGANTTIPFRAGSLRFAECDGYLYIRTCHRMYTSEDGLRHQANVMINFRIADTTITDSYWKVMNNAYGYVSHSFNQFVLVDGDDLLAVDHGDAYPRSVVLFKYVAPAGQDTFQEFKFVDMGEYWMTYYVDLVNVLHIDGQTGANDTGVALGGFEASDSAYLIAGNTVSQEPGCDLFGQRNIFISVTSKDDFSENGTVVRYLTNYAEGDDVDVSNPHFVKISGDRFAVLWTETADDASVLRYCFVDGQGNVQGQIYTTSGALSDCVPTVAGDKLVWYVTDVSDPAFFTIDLDHPEDVTHEHLYTYEYDVFQSYDADGFLISACVVCGQEGPGVRVPAMKNLQEYTLVEYSPEPTCTQYGYAYYRWNDADKYQVDGWLFPIYKPALGHDWVEGNCQTPKTCVRCGETDALAGHSWLDATCTAPQICTVCGLTQGEPKDHNYVSQITKETTCTEDGEKTYTCSDCGDSYTETLLPFGHFHFPEEVKPTCTEPGYTAYVCIFCADTYKENFVEPTGHSYYYGGYIEEPTCQSTGWISLNCMYCGHTASEEVPAVDHYYFDHVVNPTCTIGGWTIHDCIWCDHRYLDNEVPALGHQLDEGVVTEEPTCTDYGEKVVSCTNCSYSYEERIPMLPHAYEEQIDPPTCDRYGYSRYVCTLCGHNKDYTDIPATGHNYVGGLCAVCGDKEGSEESMYGYTLMGTVTSLPGDDVTVDLLKDGRKISTMTLSGGNTKYIFKNLKPGLYILYLTKNNHVTVSEVVMVGSEDMILDLELYPVGDITGDGDVNIKDFQRLLRHINKTNLLSEEMLVYGDVTGDGVVNIKDFQRLLRHINKTNPLF